MAFDFSTIGPRTSDGPIKAAFYGPPGVGKTTFASEWPNPVFMFTEDGAGTSGVTGSDVLKTYEEVDGMLQALFTNEHDFETLIVDTIDYLEPLIWAETCKRNSWANIEAPGYGKGYVGADEVWREFFTALDMMRTEKGMNIVILAHAEVKHFEDPMRESYDRYQIRLHKRAAALVEDHSDMIGFLSHIITTAEDKTSSSGKKVKAKAPQHDERNLQLSPAGSAIAKNRFDMPPRMMVRRGEYFDAIAPYLPRYAGAEAEAAE